MHLDPKKGRYIADLHRSRGQSQNMQSLMQSSIDQVSDWLTYIVSETFGLQQLTDKPFDDLIFDTEINPYTIK